MRADAWGKVWVRLAVWAALAGLLSASGLAVAQSLKDQIVGAWRLTAIYTEDQGAKSYPYGENPVGLFIFDRSGYAMNYLSKSDLPAFATPNRLKGTDQEYRQVMQGMLSGFGTYTIEGDLVTIKWIASSYPNRAGTTEKRIYKIVGDEMTGTNPSAASGGTSYTKFVRVR